MKNKLTVVHFADLHLSEINLDQTKPALDFIVGEVKTKRPDLVVFAGDLIVKRGFITPTEDWLIKTAFLQMADVTRVVCIPGNHDAANRYDRVDAVTGILTRDHEGIEKAIHPNIHTARGMAAFNLFRDDESRPNVRIFALPHPSKYFYLAANETEVGENLNTVIADKLRQMLLGYETSRGKDIPTILVGHGTITGGLSDSEMVMTAENDIAIDRGWLPDFSATMYGHLHKPQEVGKAVYSGSPAPLTFGSERMEPSYTLWELPGDGSAATFERLPIPVAHQLLTIDVEEKEFKNNAVPVELLKRRVEEIGIEGAKLRLRYQIPEDMASLVDKGELHAFMDKLGAFEHKIVDEPVSAIKIRAEDIDPDLSMDAMLEAWARLDEARTARLDDIKKIAAQVDQEIPPDERFKFQGTDYRISRIRARNFKPLIDVDVNFDQLGKIVCISGENRAGKSQFAELERFVLWKELRKGTLLSDAVRHGANEGSVTVWLNANGSEYRVGRTIKLDGKGNAKGDVIFAGKRNGKFEPLNEGTAGETQAAIERVVGTYSMYRATRFGSQKEISLLVNMLPSEMKDTLQEAINVGVFDIRKRMASEMGQKIESEYENHQASAIDLEQQVSHKENVEETLSMTEDQRKDAERLVREMREKLDSAKGEAVVAEKAKDRLVELKESQGEKVIDLVRVESNIARKQKILDNRDKVEEGINRTQDVTKSAEEMKSRRETYQEVKLRHSEKQRELTGGVIDLKNKSGATKTELDKRRWELKTETEKHERKMADLKRQIEDVTGKAKLIEEVPCVETDMNETCQLLQSARQSRASLKELEQQLKNLQDNPPDTGAIHDRITALDSKLDGIETALYAVQKQMSALDKEQQKELDETRYDPEHLKELEAELKELDRANYPQLKEELLVAEERIKSLEKDRQRIQADVDKAEEEILTVQKLASKYNEFLIKARSLASSLGDAENNRDVYIERLGKIKQELESITKLERKLETLQEEIKEEAGTIEAYQMYVSAVSRDGIPFLLLEKVLPRFEQYVNDFLCVDEGFPNTLRIKVNPLRETQSGKMKDEVVIRFIDDRGEHPLGESSGWQEVAIGYALRAAMAKIQAAATGTRINHSVYDEGWGVFDETNILMGKRMIQKLGGEFGRFFFITHRQTLKEVADTQINVIAVPGGARIEIK